MRITSAAVVMLVACSGSGGQGPAEVCSETSDCDGELECLPFAVTNNGVCMEVGDTCTTRCETTADCADLGADFMCFATCGVEKVCLKTEPQ